MKPKESGVWRAIASSLGGDLVAMKAGENPVEVAAIKAAAREFSQGTSRRWKDMSVRQRIYLAFVAGAYWRAGYAPDDDVESAGPDK